MSIGGLFSIGWLPRAARRRWRRRGAVSRGAPRIERDQALLLLLSGAKLGKLFAGGGTMLVSVVVSAFVFGRRYAAGFIVSPRIRLVGVPLLVAPFVRQPNPMLLLVMTQRTHALVSPAAP